MSISNDNMNALMAFEAIAREYCGFIEDLPGCPVADRYAKLEGLLARLHSHILTADTEMSRGKDRDFEKLRVPTDTRMQLGGKLFEILNPDCSKLSEWHRNLCDDEEIGCEYEYPAARAVSLWDDLADIFCELHYGLALWGLGTPDGQAEAAWQWRWSFESHWGSHLFRAMSTIHELRYELYQG